MAIARQIWRVRSVCRHPSAVQHLHPGFRVARPSRRSDREQRIDLRQLRVADGDVRRGRVLFHPVATLRAWNRDDVVTLPQDPRQRELSRSTAFTLCDRLHLRHQFEVSREVLTLEPRVVVAPVVRRQVRGRLKAAGEEASAQRAVGDEANPQLTARRQDLRFGVARPQRVLGL